MMIATHGILASRGSIVIPPPESVIFHSTEGTSGNLRNDSSDFVGFKVTTGNSPVYVTHLGRWIISGNSGTHTLKVINGAGTVITSGSLNTSGQTAGGYAYISVTTGTLLANTDYYFFSQEVNGGDQWNDISVVNSWTYSNTHFVTDSVHAAYMGGSSIYLAAGQVGKVYVPLNFKYY